MTAPSYRTDLVDITTAEDITGWSELTGHTGGSAAAQEGDYYIQGSFCVSQGFGTKTGTAAGLEYDYGSNVTTVANGVFLFWQVCLAGNAMDTFANGGQRLGIGSSSGNIKFWISGGSDFNRNPYGGWSNIAIDPEFTPDYTEGTPVTQNYRIFGSIINLVSQVSKGNAHGMDAIRYGRAELIVEYGDGTNGYGTVAGMASANDSQANRWGLMQSIAGGYLWKGLWTLGTGTPVDFRDSNRTIVVEDTPRVYASFNRIEVNNTGTRVDWTGFTISALGTTSRGQFEVIDDATVNKDTCVFNDMDTFIYRSNSTIINTTYRRCNKVTQGGATITNSVFDASTDTIALDVADNISLVTDCTFISSGTGYALEGFTTAASYNLVGLTFSGYAASDGSTGNEAIHVLATSGTVTLNISGGGNTPSIHSAGATVNVVAGAVTVKVTATTDTGTAIPSAHVHLRAADATGPFPYQETVTITRSGSTATVNHTAHGMQTNDKVYIYGSEATELEYVGVHQITVIDANSYSYTVSGTPTTPASGTITSTFVALDGTTDVNGEISISRVYSADQPVVGWSRKSDTSPFYKQASINGTVLSASGFTYTAVMVSDE